LGTKYSEALNARYLDDQEKLNPIVMGCYGIGINRILAALAETQHDEFGLVWPLAAAPYELVLTPLNTSQAEIMQLAEQLYRELSNAGVDILLDDRDQRPGVKLKDADLIGIPLRVVIGGRGLKEGKLEVKWRWEPEPTKIEVEGAAQAILAMIVEQRRTSAARTSNTTA